MLYNAMNVLTDGFLTTEINVLRFPLIAKHLEKEVSAKRVIRDMRS